MKNPGLIFDLGGGRFGLSINREQNAKWILQGKAMIHVFTDRELSTPELDGNGKPKKVLKDITKMKHIGFQD